MHAATMLQTRNREIQLTQRTMSIVFCSFHQQNSSETATYSTGVQEADVVVLLCDGQEGPTVADEEVIDWMRRVHSRKQLILAVNKCESATQGELQAASFWNYGHEPLAVSAISGVGTGLLMERLIEVRCCNLILPSEFTCFD